MNQTHEIRQVVPWFGKGNGAILCLVRIEIPQINLAVFDYDLPIDNNHDLPIGNNHNYPLIIVDDLSEQKALGLIKKVRGFDRTTPILVVAETLTDASMPLQYLNNRDDIRRLEEPFKQDIRATGVPNLSQTSEYLNVGATRVFDLNNSTRIWYDFKAIVEEYVPRTS